MMTTHEALFQMIALREQAAKKPADDEEAFFNFCFAHINGTKSQLLQELWVLYELGNLKSGYFVEFGAANGVHLSNTFYLEKMLGWKGILAEPSRIYYPEILKVRDCAVDPRCVWTSSGEILMFNETPDPELSTIDSFTASDHHVEARKSGMRYPVTTISLNDLLAHHHAPRRIDYISADTEGSELEILSAFDFSRYDVRTITVEHNLTALREPIRKLLTSKGFKRKFENLSRWDDWYIKDYM